jgi:hypothetical protein
MVRVLFPEEPRGEGELCKLVKLLVKGEHPLSCLTLGKIYTIILCSFRCPWTDTNRRKPSHSLASTHHY